MKTSPIQLLKKRAPSLLLGASLGLAGGWLLRGEQAPVTSLEMAAHEVNTATPSGPLSSHRQPASPGATIADAEVVRSFLRLACAADTAELDKLAPLLLKSRKLPAVLPFMAAHWAQRDAAHMFAVLSRDPEARALATDNAVTTALFDHWMKTDLDAALAALTDPQALPEMNTLRSAAVRDLLYNDPRRALDLISEWKCNLHYNDMGGISEWTKREPSAAADAAAKVGMKYVGDHLIIEIAKVWKASDPAAAIQWAADHIRRFPGSMAAASMVHVVQMETEGYDSSRAKAAADAITDPALRIHLGLPPLPQQDGSLAAPAQ